ncbi:adenine-specific DNA methyltransferase (EcoRI methylase domain) [Campylobacter ureolyticus RIGS 9880]|uniref:Adenine-specific DNA methyltransferase (EcoRI methylase domain) n=1 Tax=Campylobacter ureolyticus RIGS 9880 TaxID=1032069 RepID=A0AAU8U434_9BACT|nr:adenine-specific methyltransferase EcoRI family protein [Campylobacter ureolyticus]AKT91436.1 adenine-specific DNA methyltransferase (EcoRI methylase domain) [Campylobacter ureolyticus RIGS 9880]
MKHKTPKEIFNFRNQKEELGKLENTLQEITNNFKDMLIKILKEYSIIFKNINQNKATRENIFNIQNTVEETNDYVIKTIIEMAKNHMQYELKLKENIFFLADLSILSNERYEKLENLVEKYLNKKSTILNIQSNNNEKQSWMDDKEKKPNIYLMRAKYEVDDEFYTSFDEIREELEDYKIHFKNKIVVCPCNDGKKSNFYRYFALNFKTLKLKKLITTTFNINDPKAKGTKIEITADSIEETMLKGSGDFRSKEVKEIIESADIIVTNPPFSLFRDLIDIVQEKNKKFLIVGVTYSITYKKIFELYKKGKIWLGNNQVNIFTRPDGSKKRFSNVSWFTNLKSMKNFEGIRLTKKYKGNELKYPEYDNYKIIEVTNLKNIPIDYDGVMGIPLTLFIKHNPAQFNILGCDFEIKEKYPELVKWDYTKNNTKSAILNGKELFTRIIVQKANNIKPRVMLKNQI